MVGERIGGRFQLASKGTESKLADSTGSDTTVHLDQNDGSYGSKFSQFTGTARPCSETIMTIAVFYPCKIAI